MSDKKDGVQTLPKATVKVLRTGGEIDEVVGALIAAAKESNAKVKNAIAQSLYEIGLRQPRMTVTVCTDWLIKSGSHPSNDHRIVILNAIKRIMDDKGEEISEETAQSVALMAIEQMTMDNEVIPDLQEAACGVIVSLANHVPELIIQSLMTLFIPGQIPHYFVVKAMGDVAVANPIRTVPNLREAIMRMNPLLASIKHDNLKWVFATAFWQFCEAIQTYVANIDKGKDKSITSQSFTVEFASAFDFFTSKWMVNKDKRVALAVIRALGQMTCLLSPEYYEQIIAKLLQNLLAFIKREKDILNVMQALCTSLETGVHIHSPTIQNAQNLNPLLQTLHTIASNPPDFSNGPALKTYGETLRCCEVLTRGWPEPVLAFVLSKLEPRDPACRLGAISILKHLVVSLKDELDDKKLLIVGGVKPVVLTETNINVKKALAQLIAAMASHDYLVLEGGHNLVEFLVTCSSFEEPVLLPGQKPTMTPADIQANKELCDMCDNILYLSTTTIPSMEQVMWPYLLELVVPHQFTGAASVVTRCLAFIASRKRETDAMDYYLDFDKLINLPKPQQIIAKLFVMLCNPNKRPQQGVNILQCLRSIGPVLHPSVCDMWDEKMPKLVAYLEDKLSPAKIKDWDAGSWEELVVRLLSETLKIANDDDWAITLGDAFSSQIELYANSNPYLRSLAIKQLGVVIQRNSSKDFVRNKMEFLFSVTHHKDELESNGCASAIGYCSATHLDIVLEKLHDIFALCTGKKSGGGGFFSKKTAPSNTYDVEAKNTVILAYGQIASHANPSLITSRIEIQILNSIKPYITAQRMTPAQKSVSANTINLIARAMHPSHLQEPFVFTARDELLDLIITFLNPQKDVDLPPQLRLECIEALTSLTLLEPVLSEEAEQKVLDSATRVFTLPIATGNEKPGCVLPTDEQMGQMITKLDNLFAALLFTQPTIAVLKRLINHLKSFMVLDQEIQRERATSTLLNMLRKFIQFAPGRKSDDHFEDLGELLAIPLPRSTDTVPKIRRTAIECMGLMLYIDHLLKNQKSNETVPPPECLKKLNAIRDRVENGAQKEQMTGLERIGAVISDAVADEDVFTIIRFGLSCLLDPQPNSQLGSAAALNVIAIKRGNCLKDHVPDLVKEFLHTVSLLLPEQAAPANAKAKSKQPVQQPTQSPESKQETLSACLTAFCSFAQHFLPETINALLEEPLPHTENCVQLFQALVRDERTAAPMLMILANLLNTTCLHEEKTEHKKIVYVPLPAPLAATAALSEVLVGKEIESLVVEHLEILLTTLLLRVGTCVRAEDKSFSQPVPEGSKAQPKSVAINPSELAVSGLKQFMACLNPLIHAHMEEFLNTEDAWSTMSREEDYTNGITLYVRALFDSDSFNADKHIDKLFTIMAPFLRGNYPEHRVVAITTFAELIAHSEKYPELLQKLMVAMTEGLAEPMLKLFVLKGLGNVALAGPEAANKYASTVIDALTPPLSGADETLTLEAMNGLGKVFEVVDEAKVSPFIVNLCAQIRPSFECQTQTIRAAAFSLFGTLSRFGSSESCSERFNEQVHAVMPAVVLHLYDEVEEVQHACKTTLRRIVPLTGAASFIELVETPAFDPKTPISSYENLAEKLAKELIEHFPQRVPYYLNQCCDGFRSKWDRIKANSAVMVGMLLGNLPPEKRDKATLNPGIITRQLISLLKERTPEVREKAAEAMAVLYTY